MGASGMFMLSFFDLENRRDLTRTFAARHEALAFAEDLKRQNCLILTLRFPDGSTIGSYQVADLIRASSGPRPDRTLAPERRLSA
jgi:hypothetical protein